MKILTIAIILMSALSLKAWQDAIQTDGWQEAEKNGMLIRWKFGEQKVFFEISAPGSGWLGIGFNPSSGLSGTNLIMGAVLKDGSVRMSDRHIVAPGEHHSIEEMGGKSVLTDISGVQKGGLTKINFAMPRDFSDKYHFALSAAKRYHLLIAYSREDDFSHHSMMRTEIEINM